MNGFLCIHKPRGPSSFAVVRKVRSVFGVNRVGHTGTLDPAASGLLVTALGAATRFLPLTPVEPKIYEFGIRFGMETDTLDSEGTVVARGGDIPSREELSGVLAKFTGEQTQSVPRFSAVKINGVRAYKLARSQVDFEPKTRSFTVHELRLLDYDAALTQARLRVVSTTGMYVRALARDIALALNTRGYASFVHRTAIGPFCLENAAAFDRLGPDAAASVLPLARVFESYPAIPLTATQRQAIVNGRDIEIPDAAAQAGTVLACDDAGEVIGLLTRVGATSLFHPSLVLGNARIGGGITAEKTL